MYSFSYQLTDGNINCSQPSTNDLIQRDKCTNDLIQRDKCTNDLIQRDKCTHDLIQRDKCTHDHPSYCQVCPKFGQIGPKWSKSETF